jgi:phage baseplate assembly protein W
MESTKSFLGRGWAFPPEFQQETQAVKMLEDEADIENSLEILLSTRPGERIMLPDYGCNLDELLFKPLDLTLKTIVTDRIKTAILYHEPRIDVRKIKIDPAGENEGFFSFISTTPSAQPIQEKIWFSHFTKRKETKGKIQ